MKRIKKYRFLPPYKRNGRTTTFPELKGKHGVYLIKENGKLVYIGHSCRHLYKVIYRHFQRWSEYSIISGRPLYHTTYARKMKRNKYTVRVVITNTCAQAERLERALIIKYQPRDCRQKYDDYRLDFRDKSLVKDYEETKVSKEVPF
jgi:excinuclease UvrABC nuclease subunit